MHTADATTEATEPSSLCNGSDHTIWYKVTVASDMVLGVDTADSVMDTGVTVWKGDAIGALTEVACSDESERDAGARSRFT